MQLNSGGGEVTATVEVLWAWRCSEFCQQSWSSNSVMQTGPGFPSSNSVVQTRPVLFKLDIVVELKFHRQLLLCLAGECSGCYAVDLLTSTESAARGC